MIDKLEIIYETFEDAETVLTVARDDEALWMFRGEDATMMYTKLLGEE